MLFLLALLDNLLLYGLELFVVVKLLGVLTAEKLFSPCFSSLDGSAPSPIGMTFYDDILKSFWSL